MSISRFEDLIVWQRSRDLSLAVYRSTSTGAFARDFSLRDQIRRAAVSVMSNIAEGFERYSRTEFRQYLSIARGSAAEVRSQLNLARALGYLSQRTHAALHALCEEIARLIAALHASLKSAKARK